MTNLNIGGIKVFFSYVRKVLGVTRLLMKIDARKKLCMFGYEGLYYDSNLSYRIVDSFPRILKLK